MSDTIVEPVEELPPPGMRANQEKWATIAEMVKANSPAWCLVAGDYSAAVATHLRNGRNLSIDPKRFEVESRTVPSKSGKRIHIYLRYVG